jgi:glycine cleavage system H protein
MNIPTDLKYTKEHEWMKIEGNIATVGITDYAQGELGDIVFIELSAAGSPVKQMLPCGSIEAVKAVSDLFAPVSGMIKEINIDLESNPQVVNKDPYGGGWMLKIQLSDASEMDSLLSPEDYRKLIQGE